MSGDERQPAGGATPDVLELAEAIAAGRLPRSQAEATIRARLAGDPGAIEAELAELDELVTDVDQWRASACRRLPPLGR